MGKKMILYGILGASGLAAALLVARPIAAFGGPGGGWHGLGGGFGHHRMSPAAIQEHLQVGVKWALRDVGASDDQHARVSAILGAAVTDLQRLKDTHVENRDAFRAALAGPTVDRDALERIRKAELVLAEDASRRLVQALADAAEALTPEQRAALAARHDHRR